MGRLAAGSARLAARLKARAGSAVAYTRAGSAPVPLAAVAGDAAADGEAVGKAARVEAGERDFLFPAADLAAAGLGDPRAGDRVTQTLGGAAAVFEVAPRDTLPAWDWNDLARTWVRVRTRQVS
jgi:hypothetical protein